MALLRHQDSGRTLPVPAFCTVGRLPGSALHLPDRRVSGQHARFTWTDDAWELRDLGSSNGTWLNGERLERGASVRPGQGDRIGFGRKEDVWILVDAGPPGAMARDSSGSAWVQAEDGLLALPSSDDPRVTVYPSSPDEWTAESEDEARPVAHGDELRAGDETWTLFLSPAPDPTVLGSRERIESERAGITFHVSRDEEHVELTVRGAKGARRLPARNRFYLLLTLARARMRDAENPDLSAAEQGWLHADELCDMLKIDDNQLRVDVYRLRRQLAAAGLTAAASLIERRPNSRTIRIGITDLAEEAL